jgi:hypothetical protein
MGIVKRAFAFSSFSFFLLEAIFFFFWSRFLFVGSFHLALLQPAIRTRFISVPGDDSKSVKRNERAQSKERVQSS